MKRSKWKELIVTGICHILVFPILIQTTVFAETLPSTKQVREGTNHSLTAEKPKVNNHRQRINYMMKKHWHCQKCELIDNEANVTSQTIRERIETPNLTYRYGFINEEGSQ